MDMVLIPLTIRFEYQESHKVDGDLSYRDIKFEFENEDRMAGFMTGLNFAIGRIYTGYEIV